MNDTVIDVNLAPPEYSDTIAPRSVRAWDTMISYKVNLSL
jgi:hypothetical protein